MVIRSKGKSETPDYNFFYKLFTPENGKGAKLRLLNRESFNNMG
jgi:hypothetical protein